jgi:hypothetical protein
MFIAVFLWLTNNDTELGKLRKEIESIHQTLTREDNDESGED